MAGKNFKQGHIPTHERMSAAEQVACLLAHVDRPTALAKARGNAEKRWLLLNTYPRNPPHMDTVHGLALAYDFWLDVARALEPQEQIA
jgi:hypothetical protein